MQKEEILVEREKSRIIKRVMFRRVKRKATYHFGQIVYIVNSNQMFIIVKLGC